LRGRVINLRIGLRNELTTPKTTVAKMRTAISFPNEKPSIIWAAPNKAIRLKRKDLKIAFILKKLP